jgi:hypothetical protein
MTAMVGCCYDVEGVRHMHTTRAVVACVLHSLLPYMHACLQCQTGKASYHS